MKYYCHMLCEIITGQLFQSTVPIQYQEKVENTELRSPVSLRVPLPCWAPVIREHLVPWVAAYSSGLQSHWLAVFLNLGDRSAWAKQLSACLPLLHVASSSSFRVAEWSHIDDLWQRHRDLGLLGLLRRSSASSGTVLCAGLREWSLLLYLVFTWTDVTWIMNQVF